VLRDLEQGDMRVSVKIIPVRAGTAEPAGEPRIAACPPDVERDTILSFLTQRLGEIIETIGTSTERHGRIDTGWAFPGTPATESQDAVEFACVPFIEVADRSLQPMFEVQADQRLQFGQQAESHGLGYTLIQRPSATTSRHPDRPARAPARLIAGRQDLWRTGPGAGGDRPPGRRNPCTNTLGPAARRAG
jgi:hypothetical protein